jgi:hypothetical protein
MLNNKTYIQLFTITLLLTCCRMKTVPFNDTKITTDFFKNVPSLWVDRSVIDFDSITIYKAVLQEELVNRDGIPEYKLINSESKQTEADLVGRKNYHELYLCQVHTNKKGETLCVFLASSFDVHHKCTKLGPAYLGRIRMEQINIKKELKIKETRDLSYFISDTTKRDLLFIAQRNIPFAYEKICGVDEPVDSLCNIRIREIINSNTNKVGGTKSVLFSIKEIFSDTDALLFKYYKTITKKRF